MNRHVQIQIHTQWHVEKLRLLPPTSCSFAHETLQLVRQLCGRFACHKTIITYNNSNCVTSICGGDFSFSLDIDIAKRSEITTRTTDKKKYKLDSQNKVKSIIAYARAGTPCGHTRGLVRSDASSVNSSCAINADIVVLLNAPAVSSRNSLFLHAISVPNKQRTLSTISSDYWYSIQIDQQFQIKKKITKITWTISNRNPKPTPSAFGA